MNDALRSILCEQKDGWMWDPYVLDKIKFNRDGTGELWFLEDHQYLFAVNFRWNSASPPTQHSEKGPAAEPMLETNSIWSAKKQAQVLGKLDLEITLERSLAKGLKGEKLCDTFARINEERLSDAACRPKLFTVTIEKGNFVPTTRVGQEDKRFKCRYELRLLFDKTLVPPQEEFTDPKYGMIEGAGWWRIKDYVARQLPESEHKHTAMNDNASSSSFGSCVVL